MGYQQLPPVAFAPVSQEQRDSLDTVGGLTVFNLDTNQIESYLFERWAPHLLTFGLPNAGDVLSWDSTKGFYVPTPTNTPLLSSLKVYNDSTRAIEVKRLYRNNVLTNTSGLTTGTMTPSGVHTLAGAVDITYRVQIDSVGTLDEHSATFKWSVDAGVTFPFAGIPISTGVVGRQTLLRIPLSNGVSVTFTPGNFSNGDRWNFVTIASGNQVYDLNVDTTTSTVQVGTTLQIVDTNFNLKFVAAFPTINLDADTKIDYSRTNKQLKINVRGGYAQLGIYADGTFGDGTQYIQLFPAAMFIGIAPGGTPPPTGAGFLYANTGVPAKPSWQGEDGVKSIIPQAAKAETITGTWTFTAATITTLTAPTIAGAVTASGAWSFTKTGTSITVTGTLLLNGGVTVAGGYVVIPNLYDAVFGTIRISIAAATPHVKITGDIRHVGGFLDRQTQTLPASPAAGYLREFGFAKGTGVYQDTPRWLDSSGHDAGPAMRVHNIIAHPIDLPTGTLTSVVPSSTLGIVGLVNHPAGEMLHELSYNIGTIGAGVNGVLRLALYTESGVLITGTNVTDAGSLLATGTKTVALGADLYLPAGNYYHFYCMSVDETVTNPAISCYTTDGTFRAVAGEDILCGTVVVTAGAAPATLGAITSVANRTPYFKLGGAAT